MSNKFLLIAILFFSIFTYSQNTEKDCQSAKNKYLQQNPDVANARIDAWVHYVEFGRKEGRKWPDCDELSQKNDNLKFEDFYNKFITTNSTNSVYKGTRYSYPSNPPESIYKKDYYNGKLIYDGYVKQVVTSTSGNSVYKTEIKHGLGKQYFTNSNGYLEGYFSDDKLSGYGVQVSEGYSYKGLFINGIKSKEGIIVSDGLNGTTKYIYEGKFFREKYHGTGTLMYDFMVFVGEFEEGRMSAGIAYYPNGVKYIGGFANEKYHGYGSYYWGSGNVYKGDFKEGKFHGNGVLSFSNGKIQSGIFENGNYIGEEKKQIVENNLKNTTQKSTIVKSSGVNETQNSCNFKFIIPKITWKLVDNRRKCSYCRARYVPYSKKDIAEAKQINTVQSFQSKLSKHWEVVNASDEHKENDREKLTNLFRKNNYSEIAIMNAKLHEMQGPLINNYIKVKREFFLDNSLNNLLDFSRINLYDVEDSKYCSRKCEREDY
jgi:hypothetical protein